MSDATKCYRCGKENVTTASMGTSSTAMSKPLCLECFGKALREVGKKKRPRKVL